MSPEWNDDGFLERLDIERLGESKENFWFVDRYSGSSFTVRKTRISPKILTSTLQEFRGKHEAERNK